jgi:hypothetical protein
VQGIQGASGTGGQQGTQGATGAQGSQGTIGTNGYGYQGLQTDSLQNLTMQTGTVNINVNQVKGTNAYAVGNRVRIATQANPSLYWEEGSITAYTGSTMTVNVDLVNVPGGTYNGFNIGITGQQGNIGLQGIQGTNGQGITGTQGAQGPSGGAGQSIQGTQGRTGTNGTDGSQGPAGTNGSQGSTGPQGPAGTNGTNGTNGSNGSQGATGAGFSSISPAYTNALVISNGTSNAAYTNSSIYTSGNNVYADGFFQNSSRTFKSDITNFDKDALEILNATQVVNFFYTNDNLTPHIGFIAEDTPKELSGIFQSTMDVPSTVGVLIKAVQQLDARVKELEAKLG